MKALSLLLIVVLLMMLGDCALFQSCKIGIGTFLLILLVLAVLMCGLILMITTKPCNELELPKPTQED